MNGHHDWPEEMGKEGGNHGLCFWFIDFERPIRHVGGDSSRWHRNGAQEKGEKQIKQFESHWYMHDI